LCRPLDVGRASDLSPLPGRKSSGTRGLGALRPWLVSGTPLCLSGRDRPRRRPRSIADPRRDPDHHGLPVVADVAISHHAAKQPGPDRKTHLAEQRSLTWTATCANTRARYSPSCAGWSRDPSSTSALEPDGSG